MIAWNRWHNREILANHAAMDNLWILYIELYKFIYLHIFNAIFSSYTPLKNDFRCESDISFFAWGSLEITIKVRLNFSSSLERNIV